MNIVKHDNIAYIEGSIKGVQYSLSIRCILAGLLNVVTILYVIQ